MKNRILTSLAVVLCAGQLAAQTPNELVAQGRALLASRDLKGAQARFSSALNLETNHPTANALAGVTRLLLLPQQPALSNFLSRLGIASTGRDIFNWTNDFRRDANGDVILPSNLNTTEGLDLARSALLPALRKSQENLARITGANFLVALTAAETGSEAVTVDYGDIQVLLALLHAGEFFGLTLDTYNVSVVINRLKELADLDQLSVQRVLEEYPALLSLTSPANLAASRAALTNGIARYLKGSEFVRTARLPAVGLFTLETPEEQADEARFRDYLTKVQQSLDGPVKMSDEDDIYLSLNRYFARTTGLRDLLPAFHGDRYVWNSLPSYNLGGILLGARADEVETFLRKHLGSFEGIYVGRIENLGETNGRFAVFVNAQQQARVVGFQSDSAGAILNGILWSWPLDGNGEWGGSAPGNADQAVYFSMDGLEGQLCSYSPWWTCSQLSGERQADTGTFQDAAGFYSGAATGRDAGVTYTVPLRAILTAGGTLFICSLDDQGMAEDGARVRLNPDGSFSFSIQPSQVAVTGTLNRSTLAMTGTFVELDGSRGTFTVSRTDAVSSTSGQPPAIVTQPADLSVPAGSPASFNVTASGSGRLNYQWYLSDQILLAGGRSATLNLPKVNSAQAGEYQVVVSSPFGAVTSRVARLTVTPETVPPAVTITDPPTGVLTTHDTVTLTGTASDNDRVARVLFRVGQGPEQTATGTTAWSAQLALAPGTNSVQVWSIDDYTNTSPVATWLCEYAIYSPLHLIVSPPGGGTVTGPTNTQPLILGHGYRVKAWPAPGYLFLDWTGDLAGTNARLTFLMQPDLSLQANFLVNPFLPAQGTYAGLFHPTNAPLSLTNSGGMSLTLTETGAFSGQLQFPGGPVTFAGQFGLDQRASVSVPASSLPALVLQLELVGTNRIRGTVSSPAGEAQLESLRGATALPTFRGRYTMAVPSDDDPGHPAGDGGLTLRASPAGVVTVMGWLGDGTLVQRTTSASEDGWVPLFAPLYGGKGELLGWLQLPTGAGMTTNTLLWLKSPQPAKKLYPLGFNDLWDGVLARYVAPLSPTNALGWSLGRANLGAGNLTNEVSQNLAVTNNLLTVSKPNPLKLSLTLVPADGSLSGTIRNPATGQTNVIHGVLLQPEGTARGSFLGTNESGFIRLSPTPP
jgi:hypothetical protein